MGLAEKASRLVSKKPPQSTRRINALLLSTDHAVDHCSSREALAIHSDRCSSTIHKGRKDRPSQKNRSRQKRPNSGHSSRQATYISTGSVLDSQNMTVHISELELRDDLPTLVFFGNAA